MNAWFADTFYFLALRNSKDAAHAAALALTLQFPERQLVTTAWVLTEVGDALAAPANRAGFVDLLRLLRSNHLAEIIPNDQALFERGIDLYQNRLDKPWSWTDCISFV